jgi:hypothetical protein
MHTIYFNTEPEARVVLEYASLSSFLLLGRQAGLLHGRRPGCAKCEAFMEEECGSSSPGLLMTKNLDRLVHSNLGNLGENRFYQSRGAG